MAERNAMIEIRYDNDPRIIRFRGSLLSRNRITRTINARTFALDDGEDMIRIDDVVTLVPGQSELRKVVMEIAQLRDILGQLGYVLMKSEDAEGIIQQYNEDADPQRCPKCGHEMKFGEGFQCAGYVCLECGHEDADTTEY